MKTRSNIFLGIFMLISLIRTPEYVYSQNPLKKFDFDQPGKNKVSIPFEYINNLIILPVTINNSEKMNFILDTGISTTMITELGQDDSLVLNFAREIQLQGLGIGAPLNGLHSYGNEIKIQGISGQNQDIYVILDNAFQLSARMGMPIHGILGYSMFSDFIVSINYESKQISFFKPDRFTYKKQSSKYVSIPLEIKDTKPYVLMNITDDSGNVFPVKLLIDSGASHAIWLDGSSIPGLIIPAGSKETYLGTGLNGEVFGFQGRLNSLDVSGNVLSNIIVSFPDSASISKASGLNNRNGSIGSEVLRRFNLIIDYPNKKISFKPNSYFKSDFVQNLSGMEVIAPYPGLRIFVVEGIRKDSPADRSGLLKGDVIVAIGGKDSETLELSDIYNLLQNQAGRKLNVSFRRDGVLMTTSFRLEKFI